MLLPGLCSVTFRELTAEEVVALAAEAELATIEWGSDVHAPPGDVAVAGQLRRLTEAAGLRVGAYGSYYRLTADETPAFDAYLETALTLGAPCIRVWAGRSEADDADDAGWQQVIDQARRIADVAAEKDVVIACEYHGGTLTSSVDGAVRLMEEADHANLRLYWQPRIGMSDAANVAEFERVRRWCHHLHCFSWQGEPWQQLPLAAGADLWAQILDRYAPAEERCIFLEFVQEQAPASFYRDAATLREWLVGR